MEELFISRPSRHFTFVVILPDSTFPYLYLGLACKQLCFRPGEGINRRNESTIGELFRTVFKISVQLLLIDSTDDIKPVFIYLFHFPISKL